MALGETELATFLRRLERDGRPPFPVSAHWPLRPTGDPEADLAAVARAAEVRDLVAERFDTDSFRITGVKFILDGVIDACTAAMRAPYADGSNAEPIWSFETAAPVAVAADAAGLRLAMHAIGDRASEIALDLVDECVRVNGPKIRTPRIEHLESCTEATIRRMAALGVTASMRPVHCDPAIMGNWKAMLGDERAETGFPWQRFREAGVPIALGTDAPTAPHEAAHNLFIALTTRSALEPGPAEYHPERAFTPAQALDGLTRAGGAGGRLHRRRRRDRARRTGESHRRQRRPVHRRPRRTPRLPCAADDRRRRRALAGPRGRGVGSAEATGGLVVPLLGGRGASGRTWRWGVGRDAQGASRRPPSSTLSVRPHKQPVHRSD